MQEHLKNRALNSFPFSGTETVESGKAAVRIAYSGVPGAYAHIAARKIFQGDMYEFVAHSSFGSVYEAVSDGKCEYGVLPIENSFAGDVSQVLDLLYFGGLYISGICEMPINHSLLGIEGTELSRISSVYSHPQALDQCADYIRSRGFIQTAASNTAMAAKEVAEKQDPSVAAIASRETAALYGLKVLDDHIHTSSDNTTRFAVVSHEEKALFPKREAFSLILTVKNEAGAFAKAITTIGLREFNMRAIRSRPAKQLAWSYYFYIEGEGDLSSENGLAMLQELKANCEVIRVLGNYAEDIMLQ